MERTGQKILELIVSGLEEELEQGSFASCDSLPSFQWTGKNVTIFSITQS